MSRKIFTLLISFYFLTICIQNKRVHAFSFYDIIRGPLGQISESIFGWNPFKLKNPLGSSYLKTSLDDFDLLKTANNLTNDTITKSHYKYGCTCLDFSCKCCSHVEINRFGLNETGCLSLFYTNKNYTVDTRFHLNDNLYYDMPISIINPPNTCFDAPFSQEKDSKLCLKLYKLDARNKSLSGCGDLVVNAGENELVKIKMGCFRLASGSRHTETNLMSLYRNKKNFFYSYNNSTEGFNDAFNLNKNDFNLAATLFKKFKKLDIPNLAINFSPDKLVNNIYDTFFSPNANDKK